MFITKFLLTVLFSGLLAVSVFGQTANLDGRNLADYDKLSFEFPYPAGESRDVPASKIIDFIVDHWKEKHRGYAAITFRSKEGEPTTIHYFIEPNKAGVWLVAVRIEDEFDSRSKQNAPLPYRKRSFKAYSAEKGKMGRTYFLILRDKNGAVIH
jgi:hypothetical protein